MPLRSPSPAPPAQRLAGQRPGTGEGVGALVLSPRPPRGPRPVGAQMDTASPAGGSRGSRTDAWSTTEAWCFPLKEAAWRPVAPMLKARTNHASAALNGEIYAVGGKAPPTPRLPPAPNTWAPHTPPHPHPHPTRRILGCDSGRSLGAQLQAPSMFSGTQRTGQGVSPPTP